jgi:hypothetical protein
MTEKTDTTYQGWTNYETWLTNLWLTSNDQATYNEVRGIVTTAENEHDAVDKCADYVDHLCYGEDRKPSLAADLLRGALSQVDWYSIVESLRED